MTLLELKINLHDKIKDLSTEDLIAAVRKALLDCTIAIALAGGRGAIAMDKLNEGKRGFECDKDYYTQKKLESDCELEFLYSRKKLFQEWFDEIKQLATAS